MFLLLVVAYVFGELYVIKPLVFTAIIALALGLSLRFSFKSAKEPEFKHAMVCAALAWLVVPALSSLLFIMIEGMSPLDSFFEAMSGWTGTGLTMIAHPSSLTHTTQFWRSLMQWVGGVGVIVLMLSILARPGTGAFSLYKAEAREERIKPSIISTVRMTWWIYLILTSFGILLFLFTGICVLSSVVGPQFQLGEVMFEVASAQGNVGLSTGITNAGLSCIGKVMLILNMWIGRLEIIPVLMLFRVLVKGFEPI